MPPKASMATRRDEARMEIQAKLQKISDQVPVMLELKDRELTIDHGNDIQTQQALQHIREIKMLSTEPNVQTLAGVVEILLVKQVDADLKDDEPWKKERDMIVQTGNLAAQAIQEVRKL